MANNGREGMCREGGEGEVGWEETCEIAHFVRN